MKQNEWNEIDTTIQRVLEQKAEQVNIDLVKKEQIRYAVLRTGKTSKEERNMKKNWKKVVCTVGLICVLGVGSVIAGGKISGYKSSSNRNQDVTEYSHMPQEIKKLGYEVQLPETFSNGYEFSSGQVTSVEAVDEEGTVVGTFPSLHVWYHQEGSSGLSLTVEKPLTEYSLEGTERDCNGVSVYYKEEQYRFVPPNYQVSEEEQALIDKGELYVSYGSDVVKNQTVKSVVWRENGTQYLLMTVQDTNMGAEEFFQLAEEVIEAQKK